MYIHQWLETEMVKVMVTFLLEITIGLILPPSMYQHIIFLQQEFTILVLLDALELLLAGKHTKNT